MEKVQQNKVIEFCFTSKQKIGQPEDIDFSANFVSPSGKIRKVPGFWDGGDVWKIRYSSTEEGIYSLETECQQNIKGLSDSKSDFRVIHAKHKNPLYKYGFPVARNGNITYLNGKEFFWLGDTWWMGLCKRLTRDGFRILAKDRAKKGFTVVQIVAGLYPDMVWYDPRGKGEKGFPYTRDFSRMLPGYFKAADWRIQYLVELGIVPCIVGAWGYYINWTGTEKMKKHWRNIIARWSAYPVIWCVAGETTMPYYLSTTREDDQRFQKKAWTEVARYIKEIDSFNHPLTTHPTRLGHEMLEDPELLDINMLQTGHGSHTSFDNTWTSIKEAREKFPDKPVVIGELNYEGIGQACRQEIQRVCFWGSILSGAQGYTYGANGIWQVNTREKPYGPSPHGRSWGDTPWEDAYKLPGCLNISIGKRFLSKIGVQKIVPCQDKLMLEDKKSCIFAAEIPDQLMLVYVGPPCFSAGINAISGLKPMQKYIVSLIDPEDGKIKKTGMLNTDKNGLWTLKKHFWASVPVWRDWLILIRPEK
jgi:hypothetical protein